MLVIEDQHINELITSAKAQAMSHRKKEIKTVDDLIWFLKVWWCKYYNRPIKDPILDSYDLQELLVEFFLLTEVDETKETNKMISDNKDELASLFDDFEHPLSGAVKNETDEEFLKKEFAEESASPADTGWSMSEKDFQGGNTNDDFSG